jgi:hypothetical protein
MNHPYIANLNGQEKYNKMLNDAEAYRRVKRITGERPSFFKTLFSLVGKSGPASAQNVGKTSKIRPTT